MYKEVYEKLETKEVEKDIYRIDQIRGRETRDLCAMKCVKDADQKASSRWREYFDKLFNGSSTQDLDDLTIPC